VCSLNQENGQDQDGQKKERLIIVNILQENQYHHPLKYQIVIDAHGENKHNISNTH
jgi:hypothetical protein